MTTPDKSAVLPYELSPVVAHTADGGIMLNNSLIGMRTKDTEKNESTLEMTLDLNDPKAAELFPEMDITFRNRVYRIRSLDFTGNTRNGNSSIEVYAERSWYELLYSGKLAAVEFSKASIKECLEYVLRDTAWKVGKVDASDKATWKLSEGTALNGINQIGATYGLQPVFDEHAKKVLLLSNPGRDRGTTFTYDKHVTKSTRRIDTTGLITRIYGQSPDGVTISKVNGGKPYLEDYSYSKELRIAYYDFKEGIKAAEMKRLMEAYLFMRAKPVISYEFELSGLSGRQHEIERFDVFDTIFIMDKDYPSSVRSKVVGLDIDWINLDKSKISLGTELVSLARVADPSNGNAPGRISTKELPPERMPATPVEVATSSTGYWDGATPLSTITVTWPRVAASRSGKNMAIDSYEVLLSTGELISTGDNTATFEGLMPNTPTEVKVRALVEGVSGYWSVPTTILTEEPNEPLPAPYGISATADASIVQVRWSGNLLKDGVAVKAPARTEKVMVEQSPDKVDDWQVVGSIVHGETTLILPFKPEDVGSTYRYRMRAVDRVGVYSPYSDTASVTIKDDFSVKLEEDLQASKDRLKAAEKQAAENLSKLNNKLYGKEGSLSKLSEKAQQAWNKAVAVGDKNVVEISYEYQAGSSYTKAPTGVWVADQPVVSKGDYLWRREKHTFGNGDVTIKEPYPVTGPKGSDGKPGKPGKDGSDGTGLVDTTITYQVGSSGTTAPTGSWSETVPSAAAGDYVWTQVMWLYNDGTFKKSYSVAKIGETGAKGDPGAKGAKGAKGDKGDQGVSLKSITPYFRMATSAPAKPTSASPSGWQTTEPGYRSGYNLYRSDKVLFSDGSYSWTDVTLVASYQVAVQALESANGKNSINTSTAKSPTKKGTTVGDVWWRVDGNGNVIAQWTWDGSSWKSNKIESEVIASLDVNKLSVATSAKMNEAVIDKLWADGLVAKTIQTASLTVGAANLYRDPALLDDSSFNNQRKDTGGYGGGGSFTVEPSTSTSGYYDTLSASRGRPTRLVPGVTYYISAMVRPDRLAAVDSVRLYLRAYPTPNASGKVNWCSPQHVSNDVALKGGKWHRIEGTFKMHQDYEYFVLGFYVASHSQAQVVFSDPMIVRQHSTTMIADGAIDTNKLAANSVTAGKIDVGAVEAKHIKSKQITSDHIDVGTIKADRIEANVFTQVASSVIPLYPGTTKPAWTINADQSNTNPTKITDGDPTWYRFSGPKGPGSNNLVEVDPDIEHVFSVWVHGTTDSVLYVELRDQDGNHAVETGGITGYGEDDNKASNYLISNMRLRNEWRKVSTKIKLKKEARLVRIGTIFGSHSNGVKGSAYLADMRLYPDVASQTEIDKRQDDAIDKIEDYVGQLRRVIFTQSVSYAKRLKDLSEPQSGGLVAGQNEAGVITTDSYNITCLGSWVGHVVVHYLWKFGHDYKLDVKRYEVTASNRKFSISPRGPRQGEAAIHWFKRPGRAQVKTISSDSFTPSDDVWTHASSTTVGTGYWQISSTVTWSFATHHSYYGIRILVGGKVVAQIGPRDGLGPLLPTGDGRRTQTVSASGDGNGRSTKFEIQVYARNTSRPSQRLIDSVETTLDYTELG